MVKEFQNLRKHLIKVLKEHQMLKTDIENVKTAAQDERRALFLTIIHQLDKLDLEISETGENTNQLEFYKAQQKRKEPLLAILSQNGVTEMEEFMYKLPPYIEQKSMPDAGIKIHLKGYMWNGEILRKATLI